MHEHILGPIIPIKELPLYVLMFIEVYTIPNSISNFKRNCIQFATTTRPINPYGSQFDISLSPIETICKHFRRMLGF